MVCGAVCVQAGRGTSCHLWRPGTVSSVRHKSWVGAQLRILPPLPLRRRCAWTRAATPPPSWPQPPTFATTSAGARSAAPCLCTRPHRWEPGPACQQEFACTKKSKADLLLRIRSWCSNPWLPQPCPALPALQRKHRAAFDDLVAGLRYGSVCINVPTLIGFATTKLTWGAYLPGGTPQARDCCLVGEGAGCLARWVVRARCACVFSLAVCRHRARVVHCLGCGSAMQHHIGPTTPRRTLAPATARCTTRCCSTTSRSRCCARPGASTQRPSGGWVLCKAHGGQPPA